MNSIQATIIIVLLGIIAFGVINIMLWMPMVHEELVAIALRLL